jgi:hypothetical protein
MARMLREAAMAGPEGSEYRRAYDQGGGWTSSRSSNTKASGYAGLCETTPPMNLAT